MERIGIFGGSFNPVHLGHLLVAQAAIEEMELTRLFFVPASQSPFKPESKPASGEDRLRWLRLSLAGCAWAEVDDQEIRRGGVSYTIDTLKDYSRRFAGADLFYLIGADQVAQLSKWKDADDLARLATFVVIPRPGQAQAPLPHPFSGQWLAGLPLAVSSSEIRARIRAGRSISHLVPGPVAEAILNSGLYL
jgi:nicotinate-nucleotide adenylyltransferase